MKKVVFFCLIFLSFLMVAKADNFNLEDNINYDSDGYFLETTIDSDDNYIAVGLYEPDPFSSLGLIAKYDRNGNLEWEKKFTDVECIRSIAVDSENNIYVLAWYYGSFSDERVTEANNGEVKLIKYDKDGKLIYEKFFNDQYESQFFEYIKINNDIVYLTGEVITERNFIEDDGEYYIYEAKENNSLVSLSLDGEILSYAIYGSNQFSKRYYKYSATSSATMSALSSRLYDIKFDDEGNVYVTGAHGEDFEVAKFDKVGKKIWDQTYGGSGTDRSSSLVLNNNNELVIAGFTSSKDLDGIEVNGYSVPLIVVVDKDGNLKKMYSFGNSISTIEALGSGYLIIDRSGFTYSLIKLDANFNVKTSKTLTDFYYYDLVLNKDNTINLSGNYKSENASFFNYSILFDVLIENVNGGKIVIEDNSFKIGDKVTVKVKPEDGYVLGAIGGIEVSKVDDETYTFIMPSEDVTLTSKFVMDDAINNIDGPIPNPETGGFVRLMVLILMLTGVLVFKYGKDRKIYKI